MIRISWQEVVATVTMYFVIKAVGIFRMSVASWSWYVVVEGGGILNVWILDEDSGGGTRFF